MGWIHDTGEEWLYDHEGWAAAQLATPLPTQVLNHHGMDPDQTETSTWAADIAPHITGWRAACECGWRGDQLYPRSEYPSDTGMDPDEVEKACEAEWDAHIQQLTPEHRIRETARQASTAQAQLADAIHDARAAGVSWDAIGRAIGTSRQSAWERWRHLDKQQA